MSTSNVPKTDEETLWICEETEANIRSGHNDKKKYYGRFTIAVVPPWENCEGRYNRQSKRNKKMQNIERPRKTPRKRAHCPPSLSGVLSCRKDDKLREKLKEKETKHEAFYNRGSPLTFLSILT